MVSYIFIVVQFGYFTTEGSGHSYHLRPRVNRRDFNNGQSNFGFCLTERLIDFRLGGVFEKLLRFLITSRWRYEILFVSIYVIGRRDINFKRVRALFCRNTNVFQHLALHLLCLTNKILGF